MLFNSDPRALAWKVASTGSRSYLNNRVLSVPHSSDSDQPTQLTDDQPTNTNYLSSSLELIGVGAVPDRRSRPIGRLSGWHRLCAPHKPAAHSPVDSPSVATSIPLTSVCR